MARNIRDRLRGLLATDPGDDTANENGYENAGGGDDADRGRTSPAERPASRSAAYVIGARTGRRAGLRSLGVAGTIIR
jgi:hypothetical protein